MRGRALAHRADRAHRLRATGPARRRRRRRRRARSAARSRPSRRAAPPSRAAPRGGRRSSCARPSPAAGSAGRGGTTSPGSARRSRAPAACARGGTPWPSRSRCGSRAPWRRAARAARQLLEQAQRPVDGGERGSLGSRHGREDSAFRRDGTCLSSRNVATTDHVRVSRRPATSAARRCASRTRRCCAGQGWFIDDLDPLPNTGRAAIVRSPFAHARIGAIDVSAALALPGVHRRRHRRRRAPRTRGRSPSALGDGHRRTTPPRSTSRATSASRSASSSRATATSPRTPPSASLVDYEPLPVVGERRGRAGRGRAAAARRRSAPTSPATGASATATPTRPSPAPTHVVRERFRHPRSLGDAGRVLRRDRRLGQAGGGDRLGQLPGPVHAARRRGRRARHPGARSCAC